MAGKLPILVNSNSVGTAFTAKEQAEAREQLARLLQNPFFSHSRRFPAFLRFVVEHTLNGEGGQLKERTLGIEIFGKEADYDTSTDPIVRVTAAEIRKRIAQYYQAPEHNGELRLLLLPGSYVPQFHWPEVAQDTAPPRLSIAPEVFPRETMAVAAILPPAASSSSIQPQRLSRLRRLMIPLSVLLLIVVGTGLLIWRALRPSALQVFWAPITSSADPVLFCIADQSRYTEITLRDAADPSRQVVLKDNLTAVIIDDLSPIVKMAGMLQSRDKKYTLRGEQNTMLSDLRNGPTIFVGAYDNAWTLRLLKPLRFHFVNNPEMTRFGVVDTASQQPTPWMVDRAQQLATNNYRDYGIVARFTDTTTGRPAIIAAGVGRGGTIAAGEFLTDSALLARLNEAANASQHHNVEAVLSTQIIDGEPGTPRIEAIATW